MNCSIKTQQRYFTHHKNLALLTLKDKISKNRNYVHMLYN